MVKGWYSEQDRHSLAAKGISTGRRKRISTLKDEKFRAWLRDKKNIDDRILLSLGKSGTIGSYKKEFLKEQKEHPSFSEKQIGQIVKDHKQAEPDEVSAKELQLFIENDADLYRQQYEPILKNLARKKYKGTYDSEKAPKLFMYLVDNGARKYNKEVMGKEGIPSYMNKPTREIVARNFAKDFETEFALGNYAQYKQKRLK